MKKTNNIEQILEKAQKTSLPADRKDFIRARILAEAKESLKLTDKPVTSPWFFSTLKYSTVFASLALLISGVTLSAKTSMPGDSLYMLKVNILEPAISLSISDIIKKSDYSISLMEKRLEEIQYIANSDEDVSSDDVAYLFHKIDEHSENFQKEIQEYQLEELSREEKIETLAKLSAITKAQAKLSKSDDSFKDLVDDMEETSDVNKEALLAAIEDFAEEEGVAEVQKYLSDNISQISSDVNEGKQSATQKELTQRALTQAEEAIADGDIEEALSSIIDLQSSLISEKYLIDL